MPFDHHFLHFRNRLARRQTFGADIGAIHDRVAAVQAERVFEFVQPFPRHFIPAIGQPAVSLKEDRGAQKFIAVPPIAGATGRAASAKNAFVQPVNLGPVFWRLEPFLA